MQKAITKSHLLSLPHRFDLCSTGFTDIVINTSKFSIYHKRRMSWCQPYDAKSVMMVQRGKSAWYWIFHFFVSQRYHNLLHGRSEHSGKNWRLTILRDDYQSLYTNPFKIIWTESQNTGQSRKKLLIWWLKKHTHCDVWKRTGHGIPYQHLHEAIKYAYISSNQPHQHTTKLHRTTTWTTEQKDFKFSYLIKGINPSEQVQRNSRKIQDWKSIDRIPIA